MSKQQRSIAVLEKLGGNKSHMKNEKGFLCAWVHSPARPANSPDKTASVQVYPSGFYKDHGGFETEWAKFGLPSKGTVEQLERAVGKTVGFDEKWNEVFPPKGKSLEFIKQRFLNSDMVGGDDHHVYFPIRGFDSAIVGLQTRSLLGKEYKVLPDSSRNGVFNPEGLEYDTVYLTEGATDTFSLCSFLPNVVGVMSCSWLSYLENCPKNKTYISLLDNDAAGYDANTRLAQILPMQFVDFTGHKDVNEWLLNDPKKLLSILKEGPRTTSPAFDVKAYYATKLAAGTIGVKRIGRTGLDNIPTGAQLLRLAPFSVPIAGAILCSQERELKNGLPIVTHDITTLEAEYLAYHYQTIVYIIKDDR